MSNFLDLAGLTAYDKKIKEWFKSSTVDITDDAINALFTAPEPEIDLTIPYVTFTAEMDNSTIGLVQLSIYQTLEYSTDTTTWNTFDKSTNISLNNGDKVYVRGILSENNTDSKYTRFRMTGKIAASGNCNAIWNYQDLNAPLKNRCGYWMFSGCNLITAPELPATTLAKGCYNRMFNGCKYLNYIKCLATDISANECTKYWVSGVASTGTFIKHPSMTYWSTGGDGIPSGWTVVDAEV